MKISDLIVEHPMRKTITGSATVQELSQLMKEENVGAVVVSNDSLSVDGIISERDIAYGLSERRGNFHLVRVSTLMTKNVITCALEDTVKDALLLMAEHSVRHIPVVENGHVLGLVSMRDIIELRLGALERRTSTLKDIANAYESAKPSTSSPLQS